MADGIEFDFSQLDQLTADLGEVAADVGPNIRKAVEVTSLNIKKAWQEPLKGSSTLPGLPYAISYDISTVQDVGGSVIKAEIGFDKNKSQGPLGSISEFGSPTITGRGYGLKALEANEGDFVKGLEIATERAEKDSGLQ